MSTRHHNPRRHALGAAWRLGAALLLLGAAGCTWPRLPQHDSGPHFRATRVHPVPVIGRGHRDAADVKFGFEGGMVIQQGGAYHLFVAEMAGDPLWAKMRLAYWSSPDLQAWRRVRTLYETSGALTPGDRRFSLWSPLPVYDPAARLWNLFYVAYRLGQGPHEGMHMDGQIWRAVSTVPGPDGLGGPYRDVAVVLERPHPEEQPWEGQQGVDSFYAWQVGERWIGLYGGHTYLPQTGPWLVGQCWAPALAGPWQRFRRGNPLALGSGFIENPLVQKIGAAWVALYDSGTFGTDGKLLDDALHIGLAVSRDGVHFGRDEKLRIHPPGQPNWCEDVRTPLGLVQTPAGTWALVYTAKVKAQPTTQPYWAVGVVELEQTAE